MPTCNFSCISTISAGLTMPAAAVGIYPFAGKEVARAFALISTEVSDCNDDLSGLGHMELSNLKEWEDKFNWKYPVVGRLVKSQTQ